MQYLREKLEALEKQALASYAVKSANSLGRIYKEKKDRFRLCFQKDKERIIHSKAFRRLDKKTQVFRANTGDHYRTRLTHTLEVAQISRGIARRLGINEDLVEVIALAHDIGHAPFGHAGEDALNEIMKGFHKHFEHNEQSRHVVEKLEKLYPHYDGLNLSLEVIDGLIKHQTAFDQAHKKFEISAHLEAQVVNISDEIAYINHDMDDGLRSGILKIEDLEKLDLWRISEQRIFEKYGKGLSNEILISRTISGIISIMIDDLCEQTEKNIKKFTIKSLEDIRNNKNTICHFSPELKAYVVETRTFLYKNFYLSSEIVRFVDKGKLIIKKLFKYYLENPDKLPKQQHKKSINLEINIKDYIAGMTDTFIEEDYNDKIDDKAQ